jgi:hypothetical protein
MLPQYGTTKASPEKSSVKSTGLPVFNAPAPVAPKVVAPVAVEPYAPQTINLDKSNLFQRTLSTIGSGVKSFWDELTKKPTQDEINKVIDIQKQAVDKEGTFLGFGKSVTVDGVKMPVAKPTKPGEALQGRMIGADIKAEDLTTRSKTLDDTATLLHNLSQNIDKTSQKSVDDYNSQVTKLQNDALQYTKDVTDYNSLQNFKYNLGADARLAKKIISEDPTQTGFLGTLKSSFIPTQFINAGDSSLINTARSQVNAEYAQAHPVLSAVAQGIGAIANLVLIGKMGGGFGLSKVTSKVVGPGLENAFPTITRMAGLGAESGSIFGIESFISESIKQATQKEFNAGELAKKTASGAGTGLALGAAGSLPTLAGRIVAGGATMGGLTTLETYLQNGKITAKDLTPILVNSIVGAGFEAMGGRTKTDLFRTKEMANIGKEKTILTIMSNHPEMSRAEATKISSLINELDFIQKSGYYQEAPAAYQEAFKNLPDGFSKASPSVKESYFRDVSEEVLKGRTISEAIDIVNKSPVITPTLKADVQEAIKDHGPIVAFEEIQAKLGVDAKTAKTIVKKVMDENKPETEPISPQGENGVSKASTDALAEVNKAIETSKTTGISPEDLQTSIDSIFSGEKAPETITQPKEVTPKQQLDNQFSELQTKLKTAPESEKDAIKMEINTVVNKQLKLENKLPAYEKAKKNTPIKKNKKIVEPQAYIPVAENLLNKSNELVMERQGMDFKSYSAGQLQNKIDAIGKTLKEYGTEKSTKTTIDDKEITRGDFIQTGARVMIFDSVRSNGKILISDPTNSNDYNMLENKDELSIPSRDYVESEYDRVGWTKTTGHEEALNKIEEYLPEESIKLAPDFIEQTKEIKKNVDAGKKIGEEVLKPIKEIAGKKIPQKKTNTVYGNDKILRGVIDGKPFVTNQVILEFADIPYASSTNDGVIKGEEATPKIIDSIKAFPKEGNKLVGPVGYTNSNGITTILFKNGNEDNTGMDVKYFNYLVKKYPDLSFEQNEVNTPIILKNKGELVGYLMPVALDKKIDVIPLDIANDKNILKSNDNNIRQNEISDLSNVPTRNNTSGSREVTGEISGYDRATMLVEPRDGYVGTGTESLTKKERQLINETVESLLEEHNYATSSDEYTQDDIELMRNYSGAGGKESVGGEGAGLLNEYYTPAPVVRAMWSLAESLAPDISTAFEPSVGTGRFIEYGHAGVVKIDGAEISKVSGTITKILNPDSDITIGDFQELFFDKKTNKQKDFKQYDLLIGNPPFGDRGGFLKGKGEESKINRQEEYFIKRGLDMTKEGGLLIYVVNSSFLISGQSYGKTAIAKLGRLEMAYRLPENSFEDTSIGTDIVVFRKQTPKDNLAEISNEMTITHNRYFGSTLGANNILGETLLRKNRFGQTESYVKGDLDAGIKKIYSNLGLDENGLPIVTKEKAVKLSELAGMMGIPFKEIKVDMQMENIGEIADSSTTVEEFAQNVTQNMDPQVVAGVIQDNGFNDLLEVFDAVKEPVEETTSTPKSTWSTVKMRDVKVGDKLLIGGEVTNVEIVPNKGTVITTSTGKQMSMSWEDTIDISNIKKPLKASKAPKFSQTIKPKKNVKDKVVAVQNISNKVSYSPVEINMLKRIDRDLAIQSPTPEELPFLNYASNEYYNDTIYFSGEIYQKINQLENDREIIVNELGQEQYDKQKAGLEAVIPKALTIKEIAFDPLDRHIAGMITKNDKGEDSSILNVFASWMRNNEVALSPRVSIYDIMRFVRGDNASKDTKPIMGYIKSDAKRLFNQFLKNELDAKTVALIETKYNTEKNGYVHPDYTKLPVEIKDMAKQFRGEDFHLSETQKNGIGFLVNKGSGLIAYGVGVGKTHTLAIATKANMDKGWTKRPLFIVPKSTIQKTWIATLKEMFPGATINNLEGLQAPVVRRLIREKGEDKTKWINDGEITVISHEGILRLGLKEDELRQATGDLKDALWVEPKTKRGGEKTKDVYDEIAGNAQKFVTDTMISDLGFDHISVDEVHNFRKVFQGAKAEKSKEEGGKKRYANVIGGTPSRRAQQLFLISQYIQKNNNNRNVFLASATPFENHATEVYNILSFIARDRMKAMGILNINDFFASFANFEVELDRKLDGEWVNREKMKSFSNLPTLQNLLKEFIDYQEDPTLVRPDRRVLTPQLQMSDLQVTNLAKIQALLTGLKEEVANEEAFDEESKKYFDVSASEVDDGAFLKASTYSIANSVSPYFIKEFTKVKPTAEELVNSSPKIQYAIESLKVIKANPKTKDFGTFLFFGKMGVEYHPMIAEYIAKEVGYKPSEVAVLSGDVTDEQKEDIKERFNDGRVKVLVGGDQTKEGIDLQNNGFMTINLALGWNPTQISQVEGRVWRQGNKRSIAPLIYPLVENSGDATIFNKFEEKGGRINDLFSYKGKMFDVGEIDPAEKKLALLTDPKDKAKMQIEIDKTQFYNERLMLENDIKELKNIMADQKQSQEDLDYYGEKLTTGVDKWGDTLTENEVKEYKKEVSKAKGRIERITTKLEVKGIKDINADINDLEIKILDMDNKIKDIDKTYEDKLAFFTTQYREAVKNRKSMENHMEDIQKLVDEVQERTPEEIRQIRLNKIAKLQDEQVNNVPDYSKVKSFARSIFNQDIKIPIEEARKIIYDSISKEGYSEKDLMVTFPDNLEKGASGTFYVNKYLQNIIELYEENGKTGLVETLHESKHFLFKKLPENIQNEAFALAKKEMGPLYRIILQKAYPKVGLYAGENREKALLEEFIVDKWSKSDAAREHGYEKSIYGKIFDAVDNLLKTIVNTFKQVMQVLQETPNKQGGFIKVPDTETDSFKEQNKEYNDETKKGKEKLFNEIEKKGYDVSLIRRDMNKFDAIFAQSRDLYLKDQVEFKAADSLMKIGDERRMKKSILDHKFSDMLKPYFDLHNSDKIKVSTVLMEGDLEAKEYSDFSLQQKDLTQVQIDGYKAVRKAFNVAHELLLKEMEDNGVKPEEIDTFRAERTGYMPHKWTGRFVIKTQNLKLGEDPKDITSWKTESMDSYKTKKEMARAYTTLAKNNTKPEETRYLQDTLDSLDVDFFSEQRFSFENMKSIISKAKMASDVKTEMMLGLRNMIKEKGFGRNFIKRTGIKGYDKKEVPEIIANYMAGLNGFITKMEAGKKYYGVLESIDARRQKNFYAWARESIAYDMGNSVETVNLRVPFTNIKMDVKQLGFIYFLANDLSFLLTNMTQNITVGLGELSKLTSGVGKIYKAETALIKATVDWTVGNVTPEEKLVAQQLIKVGRLGGEMTSELMGFKNNPVYKSVTNGLNKALYNSTAFVEQNVNRIPAFLAARRLLKEQGKTDKEANEMALNVSDDINFRYGKQHRPVYMRGRKSVLFVFTHYMRSFMYQLARDLKEKEFTSFVKKLFYIFLLGGVAALPFAKEIKNIYHWIVGPTPTDDQKKTLSTFELALERGVPAATIGIDMSGRVGIDIMALNTILDGTTSGTIENLGMIKTYLGAMGSIFIDRLPKGVALLNQGRYLEAGGKLLPDMVGNLMKAYSGATVGVKSMAGNALIDENGDRFKYTTYEGVIKALGFSPVREQLAWDAQNNEWNLKNQASQDSAAVKAQVQTMINKGDIEGARKYQEEMRLSGELSSGTNYVRNIIKDNAVRDAVDAWEGGPQTQIQINKVVKDLTIKSYGAKYTPANLTAITEDFNYRRIFGYADTNAEDLRKATSNADKVLVLQKIKADLGPDEFRNFFNKGRKLITLPSGNQAYVLISDPLRELYLKTK